MQTTKLPNVISPVHFAEAMAEYWTTTLGNTSSPKLEAVWLSMGNEFGLAIFDSYNTAPEFYASVTTTSGAKPWRILQPPTGSGKTQGTALYCSMVGQSNLHHPTPVGILVVVRLIEQAKDMVRTINELASHEVAFAHHSEQPLTPEDMRKALVLVITQAALMKAFEGLVKDTFTRWQDFVWWSHGKRGLLIVDEALTGVIEENRITLASLRNAIGLIPQDVRKTHGKEFGALTKLEQLLERLALAGSCEHKFAWRSASEAVLDAPESLDLYPLKKAIGALPLDRLLMGTESERDKRRLKATLDRTLTDAQAMLERWAVYSRKGNEHTLNSALLLIPEDAPPAVVLDATASQSELWEVLGERARIQPVPQDARSYANVTLHVCRSNGMGKHRMNKEADKRFSRLIKNLEERLGPDRKVFLCVHKCVEHVAVKCAPHFERYSVGHWGAIDGRNDWQDCDTAVIFGLPYRDTVWANNVFLAVQGLRDDEWLQTPQWKGHDDIRLMMQQRQLSVSVIQAINRVRCRRVVNEHGDCLPTDVFIVLPEDSTGDAILSAIKQEMPKIKVIDWEFEPDGQRVAVRQGSNHEALLAFMDQRLPGETPWPEIKSALSLTRAGDRELRKVLRDDQHRLTKELTKRGIRYYVRGRGRGSKAYLLKAA